MRFFRNAFLVIGIFLSSLFLSSCTTSEVLPSSSGKPGEIIVVIDSVLWKSQSAQILRDSLSGAYPGLPQYEPIFKIVNVHPGEFKNILQLHRNVLIVETGPLTNENISQRHAYTQYSLTYKNNVWSKPQLVMNIRAVHESHLTAALLGYTGTIVNWFRTEERNRTVESLKKLPELQVGRDLKQYMNISMPLAEDYFIATHEQNYCWVRKETIHASFGFQFYRFPYTDKESFDLNHIISLRDSICRKYIPGPSPGSYMITDSVYTPEYNKMEFDNLFGIQITGLWRTKGDFMGGPFESYLIHDEKNGELLFIDSYVYAPKFDKREYVKHQEAMVYSITLE